jgi:hypothetical protein
MSFDPCNRVLKIQESIRDSNSQRGSSLASVRVHALTLFALPGACDATPGCPSWPTTLQPPYLGRKPKARVATLKVVLGIHILYSFLIHFKLIQNFP